MKQIAIVILHYGLKENTLACLESLGELRITNYELRIIVVDNGAREKLRVDPPAGEAGNGKLKVGELKLIRNEQNLGFSGGNDVGIQYALENGADYVLILNNDTIVDKNLIAELLKVSESDNKIGIVAPKIYFAPGFEFHKDRYSEQERGRVIWYAGGIMDWKNVVGQHRGVDQVDRGQYDQEGETDFVSGCCMFVKRDVFGRVGLFDEKYFLYYEDSDLCQRAKRKGFRIVYVPKAKLWHKNAASAGGSGSSLQDYYITRNRMLFGMRYAPFRSKVALVRESMKLLTRGRPWQRQGVIDFYRCRFGKGSFSI